MDLNAVLVALRKATSPATINDNIERAIDHLINTTSLSHTQQLTYALEKAINEHSGRKIWLQRLKEIACVCSTPQSKTEFLGFELLQQIFASVLEGDDCVSENRQLLLDVYNTNPSVLSGFCAGMENNVSLLFAHDTLDSSISLLKVIAPLITCVLINGKDESWKKNMMLNAIGRIVWYYGGEAGERMKKATSNLLLHALKLTPLSDYSSPSYSALVSLLTDLLASLPENDETTELIAQHCRHVLASVQYLTEQDFGVIPLLQSLEHLASVAPGAMWSSEFFLIYGYFLIAKCTSPLEQKMILAILKSSLTYGKILCGSSRSVYVESLILPVVSVITSNSTQALSVLQLVLEISAMTRFAPTPIPTHIFGDETFSHAKTYLGLVFHDCECKEWLQNLSPFDEQNKSTKTAQSQRNGEDQIWIPLVLTALIWDQRYDLRDRALDALDKLARHHSVCWSPHMSTVLVSTLVFLITHLKKYSPMDSSPHGSKSLIKYFHVLSALAPATTETMKIVLRMLNGLNAVSSTQPIALMLMFAIWEKESRVYPRLEAMLRVDTSTAENVDHDIVKMKVLEALGVKDPDLGIEFISQIQTYLEAELVSVAAMAINAIAALCRGDCLDFYAAFKIISLKIRKKKILCMDDPLFQERLCIFYSLGSTEIEANKKQGAKLLDQLWQFTESEDSTVRKFAFSSLNQFPLHILGLCLHDSTDTKDDEESHDEFTQDEVDEKHCELLELLKSEKSPDVRVEIENLIALVIKNESKKLTAGVGRGQKATSSLAGDQQQHLVSAAATKELRKRFTTKEDVIGLYDAQSISDWSGYLLAYPNRTPIDDKAIKRKDKLVKQAAQNVHELEQAMDKVLSGTSRVWNELANNDPKRNECQIMISIHGLEEGWRAFSAKYVCAQEELALLKGPTNADPDTIFQMFAGLMATQIRSLLDRKDDSMNLVVAGALAGELCTSKYWNQSSFRDLYAEVIGLLTSRLAQSIEEIKVFSGKQHHMSAISTIIGLQLAFHPRFLNEEEDATFISELKSVETMFLSLYHDGSSKLLQCVAILGLGRIGCLYMRIKDGTVMSTQDQHRRQDRVWPVVDALLGAFVCASTKQQNSRVMNMDFMFSTSHESSKHRSVLPSMNIVSPLDPLIWASLSALACLSSGFGAIKNLTWLSNLRLFLSHLWESSVDIVALGLGPVLLECVKFNICPSSLLNIFVKTCFQRLRSDSETDNEGILLLVIPYMLSQMPQYGCVVPPEIVGHYVDECRNALSATPGTLQTKLYAIAGIGNFFNYSFGISCAMANGRHGTTYDITVDVSYIDALIGACHAALNQDGIVHEFGQMILRAIAHKADLFVVPHKKKSFEMELKTLPSNTLLFKALSTLRDQQHCSIDHEEQEPNEELNFTTNMVASTFTCLTSSAATLPLLNYSSLVYQLMKRFCCIHTDVSCIRFCVTQASCDAFTISNLFSTVFLINYSPQVLGELISGIAILATRVPSTVLEKLLMNTFDVLVDKWSNDSTGNVILFEKWMIMLKSLMNGDNSHHLSATSLEMVQKLVTEKFLMHLPFGLSGSSLVRMYATQVLGEGTSDKNLVETILGCKSPDGSDNWWRDAMLFVEWTRCHNAQLSKRQTALVFQWLLRQDFRKWMEAAPNVQHTTIYSLAAVLSDYAKTDDMITWLPELIDAIRRSMAGSTAPHEATKCRVLFAFLACVLSWKQCLNHEKFLLMQQHSLDDAPDPAFVLLPFGLVSNVVASKSYIGISEQLSDVCFQVPESGYTSDCVDYPRIFRSLSRYVHVSAVADTLSINSRCSLQQFWSLDQKSI